MTVVFLTVYMILASISVGYSKKVQMKESIGKETIAIFMNNHLLYVWWCIIIWMSLLYNALFMMYMYQFGVPNPEKEGIESDEIKRLINQTSFSFMIYYITLFILLLQGLALSFVRALKEPLYKFVVTREWKSWFGELYNPKLDKNDIRKNLAVELMNQQLSIELIFTILDTITYHTRGIKKTEDWERYQDYDFANKNSFNNEYLVI